MIEVKSISPDVAWRHSLHWHHGHARRSALAPDLVDLQFRLRPEPMHLPLIHLLTTTPKRRPHPPVPLSRIPAGQLVDLSGQQAFQATVFLLAFMSPLGVWDGRAAKFFAPVVKRLPADIVRTA
jgi:hypothetical protein